MDLGNNALGRFKRKYLDKLSIAGNVLGHLDGKDRAAAARYAAVDPNGSIRALAQQQGDFGLAGQGQMREAFGQMKGLGEALQSQADGRNLISTEALRQGLQSNLGAHMAHVGGARPMNAGMAQRQAMMGAAQSGGGMAGQQAQMAMRERNAAQMAQAGLYGQIAQQGTDAALGSSRNAMDAYGQIEDARAKRYVSHVAQPTSSQKVQGAVQGGAGLFAASDKRLKKDIKDADADADEFLKTLKPYTFKYKDEKFGAGKQLGIMAQDLEKTRLGKQAVFETGEGKAVHGAKLATALAAAAANLDRRLSKVEKR